METREVRSLVTIKFNALFLILILLKDTDGNYNWNNNWRLCTALVCMSQRVIATSFVKTEL